MGKDRIQLPIGQVVEQAARDGDEIMPRLSPDAKALVAPVSMILSLGIAMPREMHRFSRAL